MRSFETGFHAFIATEARSGMYGDLIRPPAAATFPIGEGFWERNKRY